MEVIMRKVEVLNYDRQWSTAFEVEAQKLKRVFKDKMIVIFHIGSTSVPGLKAKPIIDILPVVKDITEVDDYLIEMNALGYEARGENGIRGRRYFQKGHDNRTHHLHFFAKDSKEIIRHLAFRDYLRTHPLEAGKYGALKESLAIKHSTDIHAYIEGKNAYVKKVEQKALAWFERFGNLHQHRF